LHSLDVVRTVAQTGGELAQARQFLGCLRKWIDGLLDGGWEFGIVGCCETNSGGLDEIQLLDGADADGGMRAQHVVVLLVVLLNGGERHGSVSACGREVGAGLLQKVALDVQFLR